MSVHSLYPDFFEFLDTLDDESSAGGCRWESFERMYFGKHSDILSTLWFDCQTYSMRNIRERVEDVKRGDYGQLRSALLLYDLPGNTDAVLAKCAGLGGPVEADVYLLVGFFSPDAFVADFRGKPSIFVGLERFRTFRHYPILLAHEYCHLLIALNKGRSGKSVAQRAVREGIAVYFSRLVFPAESEHSCLFTKESVFRDLLYRYPGAREAAEELWRHREGGFDLFCGGPSGGGLYKGQWEHCPPRAGYFFGYMLVREYVERTGVGDIMELIGRYEDICVDFGLR